MSEKVTLYGIPNCDQVKKARVWLAENHVDYSFHDFKKTELTHRLISTWLTAIPLDTLVNRKGSTWRALSETQKALANDRHAAIELTIQYPSLVKRPIFQLGKVVLAGFDPGAYQAVIEATTA